MSSDDSGREGFEPPEAHPRDSLSAEAWTSEPDAKAAAEDGSIVLGFLSGSVFGVASLALFFGGAKPRTRRGMMWGLAVQLCLLVLVLAVYGDRLQIH